MDKAHLKKLIQKKIQKYGTVFEIQIEQLEIQIERFWEIKKWFLRDDCKKNETHNKVSPVFYDVIAHLHINKISQKKCFKLTEQLNLPFYQDEKLYLLSTLDIDYLARKHKVSRYTIWKHIRRCCEKDAPFKKLGMTNAKKFGGTMLFAIGYWEPTPGNPLYSYRSVKFFKQSKEIEKWRRNLLYRKK